VAGRFIPRRTGLTTKKCVGFQWGGGWCRGCAQ